jgi:hypothetical protein
VSVKLPPFWPSDPEVWFALVEAQFSTCGITAQKTKFDYIIASLTPEYATEVRDIILHPPETRPYDSLREQLIKRTATSEQRRLLLLLTSQVNRTTVSRRHRSRSQRRPTLSYRASKTM